MTNLKGTKTAIGFMTNSPHCMQRSLTRLRAIKGNRRLHGTICYDSGLSYTFSGAIGASMLAASHHVIGISLPSVLSYEGSSSLVVVYWSIRSFSTTTHIAA